LRTGFSVVVDNRPGPGLLYDWGLSILVSRGPEHLLFDAGRDPGVFEYNARRLGVPLHAVAGVFVSHWHHDHTGGLPVVARERPGLRVCGPPGGLEDCGWLPGWAVRVGPLWSERFELWEQGLLVETPRGPVLLVGCSHPGVDALAREAARIAGRRLLAVVGGFHWPSREMLDSLIGALEPGGMVCPLHCSGHEAVEYLEARYPGFTCRGESGLSFTL